MIISHATLKDLNDALSIVNAKYDGNIKAYIESMNQKQTRFKVNLRVNDSKQKGTHLSYSGRRTSSACWHVHGEYFDALLRINPKSIIYALNRKIYVNNGQIVNNWQNWNLGSMISPLKASDACMCNKRLLTLGKTKIILSLN